MIWEHSHPFAVVLVLVFQKGSAKLNILSSPLSVLISLIYLRWDKLGDIIVLPVSSFRDQAWELVEEDLWPIVAQSLGTRRLARQVSLAL